MLFGLSKKLLELPDSATATPDRDQAVVISGVHAVNGHATVEPVPAGLARAVFGMGCFWGAERLFWEQEGVYSTAAGYAGGITANPSYEDVCGGHTGHTEVVLVYFDPRQISYQRLLQLFWESHDPTQGMRQGNDHGTQYRSAIYASNAQQLAEAEASRAAYQESLDSKGLKNITTEIKHLDSFFYAEEYHQQYLHKNPMGYCALAGTGACYQPLTDDPVTAQ
ncbi:MAG: peptide-methionine (S)-S-oxide reductase MsrA [Gammaproteobacteria bacterium]